MLRAESRLLTAESQRRELNEVVLLQWIFRTE